MVDKFRSTCRSHNVIRCACELVGEVARQENRCLANSKIGWPLLGFIHAAYQRGIFVGRKVGVESGAKFRIHVTVTANAALYQKLPFPHYLLAIEPDIEIPTDTVDVRFRSPICAGVLSIRMAESDMYPGKFFVL